MILTMNTPAIAETDHDAHHSDQPTIETPAANMSEGEVKKIDRGQGKVTIKHGELRNLGMPAMTMNFHVKDLTMLDQLKPGQKIKFIAENVNGALTVIKVE